MLDTENEKDFAVNFEPPKLPFAWLGGTFLAPILVVVLPPIFLNQEMPLVWRGLIALILFSIMLLVSCIALMLNAYDMAFGIQVTKLVLKSNKRELEDNKNTINKIKLDIDTINKELDEKIKALKAIENELENRKRSE